MNISEVTIPRTIDAPDATDFIEATRVRNEIEADTVGNRDLAFEAVELLPHYLLADEPKRMFVARVEGEVVARAIYEESLDPSSRHIAWISVEVLPAFRRRGVGAALLAELERLAAAGGKTVLQAYVPQPIDEEPDRIPSPTGFGSVPRHSASTSFLLAHGFRLEQVERQSRLELPVSDIDLAVRRARDDAGPDYRVLEWIGRTPEAHLADIALLRSRMGTDAPSAGLDADLSVWTADRVRDEDDQLESSPRTALTVLAVHVPTGAVAGFSELSVPPELRRPVMQGDTIVLREHRGHRLGMLLKVANIALVQRTRPGHPSIVTFNAEENRCMLSVNEAVGFVAQGYEGAWRRDL